MFTNLYEKMAHNINLHSGNATGRLEGQYFAGGLRIEATNRMFCRTRSTNSEIGPKRVFRINEEKCATERGALNRIGERIGEFLQSQPVTHPRIKQNEDLNRKDSISDTIEKTTKLKTMLDMDLLVMCRR